MKLYAELNFAINTIILYVCSCSNQFTILKLWLPKIYRGRYTL